MNFLEFIVNLFNIALQFWQSLSSLGAFCIFILCVIFLCISGDFLMALVNSGNSGSKKEK